MLLKLKTSMFELEVSTEKGEKAEISSQVINAFKDIILRDSEFTPSSGIGALLSEGELKVEDPHEVVSTPVNKIPYEKDLEKAKEILPEDTFNRIIATHERDTRALSFSKSTYFSSVKDIYLKVGRRAVHFRCAECGRSQFILTSDSDEPIICNQCHKEIKLTKIVPGFIQCPNCKTITTFYVQVTDGEDFIPVLDILCRRCKSPVDLIYHPKHQRFESPDLPSQFYAGGEQNVSE